MKRRRRRRWGPLAGMGLLVVVVGWWWFGRGGDGAPTENPLETQALAAAPGPVPEVVFVDDEAPSEPPTAPEESAPLEEEILRPSGVVANPPAAPFAEDEPFDDPAPALPLAAASPEPEPEPDPAPQSAERLSENASVQSALERFERGDKLGARVELNRLLRSTSDGGLARELRQQLTRINDEMIFGRAIVPGDPLFERYAVQSGDNLTAIGKRHSVPHEIIMRINNIRDARRIQINQSLKVPRGPFHARVHRDAFRMDVYLGDTYVRSFPVGLGKDNGTPLGKWKVVDRMEDPTYFPPPASPIKRVVPPGDPENPLGGYWIALEGLEGDALGREGFGIHGTNDPASIGKDESLGCVRMRDNDIELVFGMFQPGASTVVTER